MYVLIIKGARRATLAYHRLESEEDLRELIAIYQALGYPPEALIVEIRSEEQAA